MHYSTTDFYDEKCNWTKQHFHKSMVEQKKPMNILQNSSIIQ